MRGTVCSDRRLGDPDQHDRERGRLLVLSRGLLAVADPPFFVDLDPHAPAVYTVLSTLIHPPRHRALRLRPWGRFCRRFTAPPTFLRSGIMPLPRSRVRRLSSSHPLSDPMYEVYLFSAFSSCILRCTISFAGSDRFRLFGVGTAAASLPARYLRTARRRAEQDRR